MAQYSSGGSIHTMVPVMQKILTRALAFIVLLVLSGCSSGPGAPASSVGSDSSVSPDNAPPTAQAVSVNLPSDPKLLAGWVLQQTNQVAGSQIVHLCPAACRLENREMDVNYVVTSADWKVYAFSDSRKLLYQTSFDGLMQSRKEQQQVVDKMAKETGDADTPYERGDKETICGLSATRYSSKSGKDPENPNVPGSVTEMWFTSDIQLPSKFSQLQMQPGEGLPAQGILLRMTVTEEGEKTTILDTVSVKRMQISPDTFRVPPDYTVAASEAVVTMGEEEGAALQDMYHGMEKPSSAPSSDDTGKKP